jgi:hypothetical protein
MQALRDKNEELHIYRTELALVVAHASVFSATVIKLLSLDT